MEGGKTNQLSLKLRLLRKEEGSTLSNRQTGIQQVLLPPPSRDWREWRMGKQLALFEGASPKEGSSLSNRQAGVQQVFLPPSSLD